MAPTLYISESVYIKSDRSVNFLLLGKCLKPGSLPVSATVSIVSDVVQVLNTVETIKVCWGEGASIKEYPKAEPECPYGNPLGKWKHSRCSITVVEGNLCKACGTLCSTLPFISLVRWLEKRNTGCFSVLGHHYSLA